MSHVKTYSDEARSCFTCYWHNGKKVGNYFVCNDKWPQITVITLPENGCAFWTKPPGPGEPKPLTMSERKVKSTA